MAKNREDKNELETLFYKYETQDNDALISLQDTAYELGYKRCQQDQQQHVEKETKADTVDEDANGF